MVDFSEAYKEGLEAAKKAEVAKKEIDEVFADLNRALEKESKGNISIERKRYVKKGTRKATGLEYIMGKMFVETKVPYTAIVASNPRYPGIKPKELAEWSQDRAGYPCKISWGNNDHVCEDQEALENALAELLRDPIVGERMIELMKQDYIRPEKNSNKEGDTSNEE